MSGFNHRSNLAIAVTAFAFLVVMLATTMPTPLYAIYSQAFGFTPLTITVLFSVYAAGVVIALIAFGQLSDAIGRRPVMVTALALALAIASDLFFLTADTLPLLIVGRVLSGLAAGLMSGTGTAALLDLFPSQRRSTGAALAVGVNMGGLALGTLLAGLLADFAPVPLRTPFGVHLALALAGIAGLFLFAPSPANQPRTAFRFRKPGVPAVIRRPYIQAVLAGGAGWAVTSVLTATGGVFLATTLHLTSHSLAGFLLFLAFGTTTTGQLLAKRWPPARALVIGCAGQFVACVLLAAALWGSWLAPLIAAAIVVGVASGICLNAGVAMTSEQVPPDQRGAVSSALFAGLYLMLSFPAVGVGLLSSVTSLRTAGLVFSTLVAILAVAVGLSIVFRGSTPAPTLAPHEG